MKLDVTSILLAACCVCALATPSCSMMEGRAAAKPAAIRMEARASLRMVMEQLPLRDVGGDTERGPAST